MANKTAYKRNLRHWLLRRRDGNNCYICGLSLYFTVSESSPVYTTLDHIVPKSMGGNRMLQNICLTHKMCNHHRGNRDVTQEMRDKLTTAIKRIGLNASAPPPLPTDKELLELAEKWSILGNVDFLKGDGDEDEQTNQTTNLEGEPPGYNPGGPSDVYCL